MAQRHVPRFVAQHVANTAWAFAKVGQRDTPLFTALSTEAQVRLSEFTTQGLVMCRWAFGTMHHPASQLFTECLRPTWSSQPFPYASVPLTRTFDLGLDRGGPPLHFLEKPPSDAAASGSLHREIISFMEGVMARTELRRDSL